jgi:transcriptional regulator with XRE-family HTH domain
MTGDVDKAALGKAITIRRVELGLSRNELRDRSGLSYPYVAELEKGKKSASGRALAAIASALEMRPHELLARAESLADETATPVMARAVNEPATTGSRWFGAATTPRSRSAASAAQARPLTEERVREIVREELRRLIAEAAK